VAYEIGIKYAYSRGHVTSSQPTGRIIMRKILSTFSVLAFALALGIPAFAEVAPTATSAPATNMAPEKAKPAKIVRTKSKTSKKGKHPKHGKSAEKTAPIAPAAH
jgi:hypothetical protein